MSHDSNRCVVLVLNGSEPVGYGSILYNSLYPPCNEQHIPEIHDVWITESQRKKGLGSQLLNVLEAKVKKEGHRLVGIGVGLYKDYGAAQRLYIHRGYYPDGRGITYNYKSIVPGENVIVDDNLVLWLIKEL